MLKICPIMSAGNMTKTFSDTISCKKENCAIWDSDRNCCGLIHNTVVKDDE
jgi:hypothetical protein